MSIFITSYHQKYIKKSPKPLILLVFQRFFQCRRWDLNPYVVAHNRFWVCLVCHSDTPADCRNFSIHSKAIISHCTLKCKKKIRCLYFKIRKHPIFNVFDDIHRLPLCPLDTQLGVPPIGPRSVVILRRAGIHLNMWRKQILCNRKAPSHMVWRGYQQHTFHLIQPECAL